MAPRSYVLASDAQWRTLAAAVRERCIELGLTQAVAVQRSEGLISTAVWSTLEGAGQRNGRMGARSLAGADRSLGRPPGTAAQILHGTSPVNASVAHGEVQDEEALGIAAKAGRLTPEQRGRLTGYLDALLDELGE